VGFRNEGQQHVRVPWRSSLLEAWARWGCATDARIVRDEGRRAADHRLHGFGCGCSCCGGFCVVLTNILPDNASILGDLVRSHRRTPVLLWRRPVDFNTLCLELAILENRRRYQCRWWAWHLLLSMRRGGERGRPKVSQDRAERNRASSPRSTA
jgi:hypothetical protein